MKLRDVMTNPVIRINPEESVTVAARTLDRYNIGALPVCGTDGRLCGLITDRDIVTRCLAAGRSASSTPVRDVMTAKVITARPDMEVALAAGLMGREQIRRLPVMENGRLCGMVSLGDLAMQDETSIDAGDALTEISSNLSSRDGRLCVENNKKDGQKCKKPLTKRTLDGIISKLSMRAAHKKLCKNLEKVLDKGKKLC